MSTIVIDAVFFQIAGSGIARVWRSLFDQWAHTEFAQKVVVIDRGGTAPKYPGLRYRSEPAFNYGDMEGDRRRLQEICDAEGAQLFISTYYTTPLTTPSVLMLYDMIPELFGMDMSNPQWAQKTQAIRYASHYITISKNTAIDLMHHSDKEAYDIAIAHCGCNFTQPAAEEVAAFVKRHGIERPYFMLSGSRAEYKNGLLFFQAFEKLGDARKDFAVVCTGGGLELEPECAQHLGGASLHMLRLPDREMQCAYAGALALVYPSLYEGFGMPPLEAMACGAPVITCPKASLPEVCGDAVLYIDPDRQAVEQMFQALHAVQDPTVRRDLIDKGVRQAARFSWQKMARIVADRLSRWNGASGAVLEDGESRHAAKGALSPQSLREAVQAAFGRYSAHDLPGAEEICNRLIAAGSASFYPYYLSGVIAGELGNRDLAASRLRDALSHREGIPAERIAETEARLKGMAAVLN